MCEFLEINKVYLYLSIYRSINKILNKNRKHFSHLLVFSAVKLD